MEPTFPLLRLPENVIVQVLQNTNPSQLLIFSLASSKTKNLVIALGLKANVHISISYSISLNVNIGRFGWNLVFSNNSNDQNAEFDITRPISASCQCLNKPFQPSTSFNFSDWLDHIRTVFCYTKPIDVFLFHGSERFEMESLKNTLKNVNSLTICRGVTDIQSKLILKHFKDLNELRLNCNPFEDICDVRKFFIQNFEYIYFEDVYSLDDMLLVNSEKHWIRGSNPRLQRMSLSINNSGSVSREMLLKGIDCVDVGEEEQEKICQEHKIVSDYMVEIRRKGGAPAVIATKEFENILYICFIAVH
ncbi:hypothetical protein GCK72_008569 [Caenorhabditis remanei]|uniref:F-box domain-containing protein n=1 Tax=Caenorhabditis remanei TaxID=31234 RepID=A0A6A5H017_CAERE|nr:hypothetical protein GCK72_008569 [Caenorhabditis remanei]KAF1760321.1 hypothetical protein GCK72_008569 [Caenorhabditis remanei]